MIRANCVHCKKPFISKFNRKLCSPQCAYGWNKAKRDAIAFANRGPGRPCPTCGELMFNRLRQWCSNECIPKDARNRYRNDVFRTERVLMFHPEIKEDRERLLSAWKGKSARP